MTSSRDAEAQAARLLARLVEIASACRHSRSHFDGWFGVEAYEIGVRLYRLAGGSLRLMERAHDRIAEECGPFEAQDLSSCWAGIGRHDARFPDGPIWFLRAWKEVNGPPASRSRAG